MKDPLPLIKEEDYLNNFYSIWYFYNTYKDKKFNYKDSFKIKYNVNI